MSISSSEVPGDGFGVFRKRTDVVDAEPTLGVKRVVDDGDDVLVVVVVGVVVVFVVVLGVVVVVVLVPVEVVA